MVNRLFFFFILFTGFLLAGCSDESDPGNPEEVAEIAATAKVMSYNIHHANPPSKPGVIDIDAIVTVIRAEDADLIALQEVDVHTERSGGVDQAALIADKLGMYYFFAKAIDYQGGAYGVAILSKYRLSEETIYRLPTDAGTNGEPRIMAVATLKLPDSTTIRFASTHLDAQSDPTNRLLQINEIVSIVSDETRPFVIAGDFNATPNSEVISILDGAFDRTCRLCPPTIPVTNPTRVIDYIAYRHPENKFSAEGHEVVNEVYASDHRPITAVVNLEK